MRNKDIVEGITKAALDKTPVYQDAIQPLMKEVGKTGELLGKTINMVLCPVAATVWSYEKIRDAIVENLEYKLREIPIENIQTPDISIAGPIIENMRFYSDSELLRELFLNVLSCSMQKNEKEFIHPSYVETIKNLSIDEAIILKYLKANQVIRIPAITLNKYVASAKNKGYKTIISAYPPLIKEMNLTYPEKVMSYFENLIRIGLIEFSKTEYIVGYDYDSFIDSEYAQSEIDTFEAIFGDKYSGEFKIVRGMYYVNNYGSDFISCAV